MRIKLSETLEFGYELFAAAVSILSVFNMLLAYVPGVDPVALNVVYIVNAVLTLLFIHDFGLRLLRALDRPHYFIRDFGWADLLAIAPRFRVWKTYRIVKKYGMRCIISYLSRNRSEAALLS